MGRPRTILIDPLNLLATIAAQQSARLAEIDADIAAARERGASPVPSTERSYASCDELTATRQRNDLNEFGMEYDLPRWLGFFPIASERIRGQEAIRKLEGLGLVKIFGVKARQCLVLPAGYERLAAITEVPHA